MAELRLSHLCVFLFFGFAALLRSSAAFDYSSALSNSILFFEGQRSGVLPSSQRVQWRANSGLHDGAAEGVDLVGGYYDAGDNVKYGLPMAFTITMLSWSALEYSANIASAGQEENVLDAIKWGTDYFIKAHPEPNVLWGEVGDGDSDHYCWQRPEEMTTSRQAYQINAGNPGSDLAGETAAAMAAASMAFRRTNAAYANVLVTHAKQLFSFADTYRGKYDSSISVARNYYQSQSGYDDELLWAALWLFEATSDQYYLNYAIENANSLGGVTWGMLEFSWDVKYSGLQVLASKILFQNRGGGNAAVLQQYRRKADFFMCACLQKNGGMNVARTPGGLMYTRAWNNMQYVSTASFLLTVYSDYLSSAKQQVQCSSGSVQPSELLAMAKSQVDYILGNNPRGTSYMVGFGENYPQRVHHRGASIVSYKKDPSFIACRHGYGTWYVTSASDPNVHVGALVGGPDENDDYADSREDFEQSEPATYHNAPLVGVLARINSGAVYAQFYPALKSPRLSPRVHTSKLRVTQVMTDSWSIEGQMFHRYEVTVKNNAPRTLRRLELSVSELYGPLWGLSENERGTFTFPYWIESLPAKENFVFVYYHPAPPAAVSVASAIFA